VLVYYYERCVDDAVTRVCDFETIPTHPGFEAHKVIGTPVKAII